MKKTLFIGLLIANLTTQSQTISISKLIELAHKPFTVVSDTLINRGWRYAGVDTANSDKYSEAIVWTYKYDKVKNEAKGWLSTHRNYSNDTVDLIHQNINQYYYEEFLKLIPSLNFKQNFSYHKGSSGFSKVYERNATTIELRSYVAKGNTGINQMFYDITVVKLIEDADYLKAKEAHNKSSNN